MEERLQEEDTDRMAHQGMDPLEAAVADPVAEVEIMAQVALRVVVLVVKDHLAH